MFFSQKNVIFGTKWNISSKKELFFRKELLNEAKIAILRHRNDYAVHEKVIYIRCFKRKCYF